MAKNTQPAEQPPITVGTNIEEVTENIKSIFEVHNIPLGRNFRYNIKLINGDFVGANKIIEFANTPDVIYALSTSKDKESIYTINKSRIVYISVYSEKYTEAYNSKKGY